MSCNYVNNIVINYAILLQGKIETDIIHLYESCHGAKYENYQNNVLSMKINSIIAN